MKRLLTIISIFFVQISFGQIKVIEVDSVTGAPSQSLPFDEKFVLKIPVKQKQISSVAYIKHGWNKDFKTTLDSGRYKLVNFKPEHAYVRKIDNKDYLVIKVYDRDNLLDPGSDYTFFWAEGTNDKVIKYFDNYNLFITTNDSTYFKEARKLHQKLVKDNEQIFGKETLLELKDSLSLSTLKDKYSTAVYKFDELYKKLYKSESTLNKLSDSLNLLGLRLDKTALKNLLQEIIQSSNHFDSKWKGTILPDQKKSAQSISKILELDNPNIIKNLFFGLIPLNCFGCEKVEGKNFAARVKNYEATIASFEELYLLVDGLQNFDATFLVLKSQLKAIKDNFYLLKEYASNANEARQSINNNIHRAALTSISTREATSNIFNFESRTKLSITPDFGVVTTRIGNDGSNPYSFVPYLGFLINLRPMNKDVPFRSYKKSFLHYYSLSIGWSLVDIGNGPKQSSNADSVSSYFANGKGTLLTGIGYRLGNAVRITAGGMWYFKHSESTSNSGIFDERNLNCWPYIGLSVDMGLKDLLNGINEILPNLPKKPKVVQTSID